METIANRYAESLFELAKEEKKIDDYAKDMKLLFSIFNEGNTLISFFTHVLIEDAAKYEIVDKYFKEEIHHYVCNFIKLLIRKRRIRYIKEICISFNTRYNEYYGIEEGILYTRFDLEEQEIRAIQEAISKKEGKKVQLQVIKDVNLIGGIKIQLKNQVIDGSLKNQLEGLKKELLRK